MALVKGTNCGFVTEAPVADPEGTGIIVIDYRARIIPSTSPANAGKITEVGWWHDDVTTSEEANFEVGLYADDGGGGKAGTLLEVSRTNAKGTTAGWKSAIVDWDIEPETVYYIGVQVDDTATDTYTNYQNLGAPYSLVVHIIDTLPNPWTSTSIEHYAAIYAVWEEAPEGLNPKVKVSGTFATKKTLVKAGGTFAEKPVLVKVGGTFQ